MGKGKEEINMDILRARAELTKYDPDSGTILIPPVTEECLEVLQRALELNPNNPDTHYTLGCYYFKRRNIVAATMEFEKTAELQPEHADAHYHLAVIYHDQGKVAEAVTEFKRVIEINDKDAEAKPKDARYSLAVCYYEQGMIDEARLEYEKLLEIEPNDAEVHNNLGAILGSKGELEKGREHLERAIELRPDYKEVYNNLGLYYLRKGDRERAIRCWRKALEIDPNFNDAQTNLKHALEEGIMHTFKIGEKGQIREDELVEKMQEYATLFTTCYLEDTKKAYDRFAQIIAQLKKQNLINLLDELANVVMEAVQEIIGRHNVEPFLEEPFVLLRQIGSTRPAKSLLNIIKMKGDDKELLLKREMAAETLVALPDSSIPAELSQIARGVKQFSRSPRRVAVWALSQLDHDGARQTLRELQNDPEVADLIKLR